MLLEKLKQVIGLFRTSKEDSKARIDAAFTEHAAAIQDANTKLWTTIKDVLDGNGVVADEVETKAGEFEQYADMLHEDAMRQRRELLETKARVNQSIDESVGKIDPGPPAPGEMKVDFTPIEQPAGETVSQ